MKPGINGSVTKNDATQGRLTGILEDGDFGTPVAELSSAAIRVLEARYLGRDFEGNLNETPTQMFTRVARAVAVAEAEKSGKENWARKFFELMASLKFLPNSPTLMNAGKPKGQLSACFVLPIEDDLAKVFETLRDAAVIHKTGGGTGFSFGNLRPKGARIRSSGGKASGPLAFLKIFDVATQIVKQGGTRRGANMAILPIEHPDIEEFISCKNSGGIENFNISVGITDAFMRAVKENSVWELKDPLSKKTVKTLKARALWKSIAESAWTSGDPGLVFLDRVNEFNPTPELGRMESTNPCGEQPLLAYESCNLGSMNLVEYVKDGDFDWSALEADIATAVRFLDNIVEINGYPLSEIEKVTRGNRKIGLGVMGWADVLMEWNLAYDSDEAVNSAERVMKRIQEVAIRASEALAKEKGAFRGFEKSLWGKRGDKPRRNATVTTVAPTGTISIIAGVSSGIEPVFSMAYERSALEGESFVFVHPALKKALREYGVKSRKTLERILETGSVADVKEIPAKLRKVLKTGHEIKPIWHVKMQAAFQKSTESAVSKTINLPRTAKQSDVQKIYEAAYEMGCKGITIFRDTSKLSQVLSVGVKRKGKSVLKGFRGDLIEAVEWLLDDQSDQNQFRKRASVGLASLSRDQLKQNRN